MSDLTAPTSLFDRIGEEKLRRLLWDFYARVMDDALLAPIFAARLGPYPKAAWPVHIARLEGFWRAVMGAQSAYRGQPGPAHQGLGLAGLGAAGEHFDRWLELWEQTLGEQLPPPEAAALLGLAQRMRPTLQRFAERPPA